MFDLIIRDANLPDGQKGIDIGITGRQDRRYREDDRRRRLERKSMPPDGSSARPSSIRIFIWTPPCPLAFRA